MAIADPAQALAVVNKFIGLLNEHRQCFDQIDSFEDMWAEATGNHSATVDALRKRRDSVNAKIWHRAPLVEAIAERVDPSFDIESFREGRGGGLLPWRSGLASAHRLVGVLERTAEEEAILGPGGPQLAAGGMHKWVWDAAANLWDDRHYGEAVNAAATAVEQHTQLKLDRGDLSGADLYTQAFKVDRPDTQPDGRRLRFAHTRERTAEGERPRIGHRRTRVRCTSVGVAPKESGTWACTAPTNSANKRH